jgi:hypothetical protein
MCSLTRFFYLTVDPSEIGVSISHLAVQSGKCFKPEFGIGSFATEGNSGGQIQTRRKLQYEFGLELHL